MCRGCVLKAFPTIVFRLMNLLNRHHWSRWTQHEDIYTPSRLITSPQPTGRPLPWCLRWLNCAASCFRSLLYFPRWCHKTAYFIYWTLWAVCWRSISGCWGLVEHQHPLNIRVCVDEQHISWLDKLNRFDSNYVSIHLRYQPTYSIHNGFGNPPLAIIDRICCHLSVDQYNQFI